MDTLVITATLPSFSGNFEDVKSQLKDNVKKYDIIVTAESVADSKKIATSLNKLSQMVEDLKKEKVIEVSSPVEIFKNQMKELVDIIQESRGKITSQVKRFEDESKRECLVLLEEYRDEMYETVGLENRYRTVDVNKLAILTSMTATGKLTSKALDGVDNMVMSAKSLQDRYKIRVLELNSRSAKSGLDPYITEDKIQGFAHKDDSEYEEELEKMISIILSVQSEQKEKTKIDIVVPIVPASTIPSFAAS